MSFCGENPNRNRQAHVDGDLGRHMFVKTDKTRQNNTSTTTLTPCGHVFRTSFYQRILGKDSSWNSINSPSCQLPEPSGKNRNRWSRKHLPRLQNLSATGWMAVVYFQGNRVAWVLYPLFSSSHRSCFRSRLLRHERRVGDVSQGIG